VGQQTLDVSSQLRWFGTVRARTGVVVNDLLLYVTGGFAYARFNRDLTYVDPGPPALTQVFSNSRTRFGYAIGAGTEWAINQNWSLVSEFMYLGFEKDEQSYACSTLATCNGNPVGTNYRYEHNDSVWVSRIGLNYRFNYGPVAAKY
jgi:outer membrane immunogenic protein